MIASSRYLVLLVSIIMEKIEKVYALKEFGDGEFLM
jgi:hypothetical protein